MLKKKLTLFIALSSYWAIHGMEANSPTPDAHRCKECGVKRKKTPTDKNPSAIANKKKRDNRGEPMTFINFSPPAKNQKKTTDILKEQASKQRQLVLKKWTNRFPELTPRILNDLTQNLKKLLLKPESKERNESIISTLKSIEKIREEQPALFNNITIPTVSSISLGAMMTIPEGEEAINLSANIKTIDLPTPKTTTASQNPSAREAQCNERSFSPSNTEQEQLIDLSSPTNDDDEILSSGIVDLPDIEISSLVFDPNDPFYFPAP